ncbi:MAG TPA: ParB/RepB/Spo0J family partition protein [Acidimicrobiales bacterium]|nr:ParB/RepB/Spo0J family partition protein [Acidimicrobiales bacterium]
MKRQSGLGQGLSALIPEKGENHYVQEENPKSFSEISANENEGFVWLKIEDLKTNPQQPRSYFNDKRQQELTESIRNHGILQPILVRFNDFEYELIAGERRLRAAHAAGLEVIPAFVREVDDQNSFEQAVVENIQRDNLNAIEEATAFQRLIDEFGYTQQQVGERVGKGRPTIANSLRLLYLCPEIQEMLKSGQISAGHGRALLGIEDVQAQIILAQRVINDELSVRQTEEAVVSISQPLKTSSITESIGNKEAGVLEVENILSDRLNTKVAVTTRGGKGRIVVTFADIDDLHRIFNLLNSASESSY